MFAHCKTKRLKIQNEMYLYFSPPLFLCFYSKININTFSFKIFCLYPCIYQYVFIYLQSVTNQIFISI